MTYTITESELTEIKALAEKEAKEIVESKTKDGIIKSIADMEYELILYQNMNNYYNYKKGIATIKLNIPIYCDIIVDDAIKSFTDKYFKGKIRNTIYHIKDDIECRDDYYPHYLSNDKIFELLEIIKPYSLKTNSSYKKEYINRLSYGLKY